MSRNVAVQLSALLAAAGVTPVRGADHSPAAKGAIGAQGACRPMRAAAESAGLQADEDRQVISILLNELNHRVKNTLATVLSIAAQTMRGAADGDEAFARFESRLIALSEAQNLLAAENWRGAGLAEVVERAIAPFRRPEFGRLTLTGPKVWLLPQAAIALSLALHELAVNAIDFGALSNESGRVEIHWSHEQATGRFEFTWTEIGGPQVGPPTRRGYGTRLIDRGLRAEFGGEVSLKFEPAGVVCRVCTVLRPKAQPDAAAHRGVEPAPHL